MTYNKMASLYDQLMSDVPYDQWVEFTTQLMELSDIPIKRIADLGCGTGEITIRLANKGFDMYGIDISSEMLTHAEQKSSKNNLAINWIKQDIRELNGFNELDVVVSYCDVINYITDKDGLLAVFNNVAKSLTENGWFIFDVHSFDYAQEQMINQTFTDVTDEAAYIWDCIEGDHEGEMYHEITFFTLNSEGLYERFEESHHQRTYAIAFYEKLLFQSGFKDVKLYGDFSLKENNSVSTSNRIFFLAKK